MFEPVQAHTALMNTIWPMIKASVVAGHRMIVEVKQETRSLQANAKLHAMLADISGQIEWAGSKRDVETWKRLLTASWCRAKGEHIEVLPAIDGHGVDIVFRRTSQLTRAECADLIEFIHAWAAETGVKFTAYIDPETGEII